MRSVRAVAAATAILGLIAVAIVLIPVVSGQGKKSDSSGSWGRHKDRVTHALLEHGGGALGVSVRDVDQSDVTREQLTGQAGAVVESVESDGPAAKAGIQAGDVIVEFDGEKVRSARQLSRLVRETPANRTVVTTLVRDGVRRDLQVTPDHHAGASFSGETFGRSFEGLQHLGRDLALDLGDLNLNVRAAFGGRRLGVTVQELTSQLAAYFGVNSGILVTSVADDSPAARAGLKAGDVITSVDEKAVSRRSDLIRELSRADEGRQVTIGIVRDKQATTVKATLEDQPSRTIRRRIVNRAV